MVTALGWQPALGTTHQALHPAEHTRAVKGNTTTKCIYAIYIPIFLMASPLTGNSLQGVAKAAPAFPSNTPQHTQLLAYQEQKTFIISTSLLLPLSPSSPTPPGHLCSPSTLFIHHRFIMPLPYPLYLLIPFHKPPITSLYPASITSFKLFLF